jgi:hypothetical protein
MLVVSEAMSRRRGAVVDDYVLFKFRLRLFSLAAELGNVREACRLMDVHPSTSYRRRGPVMHSGLEMLRPRGRRPPRMPNQTSRLVESRVVAFSLGHRASDPGASAPRWPRNCLRASSPMIPERCSPR